MQKKKERTFTEWVYVLNSYYLRSGLYKFIGQSLIRVILILIAVLIAFWFVERYIIDLDYFFSSVLKSQKPGWIFILFGISESLLGLIPPDFFILWTKQFPHPYNAVTILALISYAGGIISFKIGKFLSKIPSINEFIEDKLKNNIRLLRRWGSVFIIVAALFPLPFSAVCMAVGMIRYPMAQFLLFGLTRIARFYIYALVLFGVI